MSKKQSSFSEIVKTVVYALLIALFVRTFAFEAFNIPSGSMLSTLYIGDYLFVSKYSYGYSKHSVPFSLGPWSGRFFESIPERGDVVVFRKLPENKEDYIKRLIGLPGDRIQVKDGILHINGAPVKRERSGTFVEYSDKQGNVSQAPQYVETLPEGRQHLIIEIQGDNGPADNTKEYVVPAGHYFMMGDNRDNSQDSRFLDVVGYVPAEALVGKAQFIFFSTNGDAAWWQIWKWPWAIRYSRLFQSIE